MHKAETKQFDEVTLLEVSVSFVILNLILLMCDKTCHHTITAIYRRTFLLILCPAPTPPIAARARELSTYLMRELWGAQSCEFSHLRTQILLCCFCRKSLRCATSDSTKIKNLPCATFHLDAIGYRPNGGYMLHLSNIPAE